MTEGDPMNSVLKAMESTAAFVCRVVPWQLIALAIEEDPAKPDCFRVVFAFVTDAPEWTKNGERAELRWIAAIEQLVRMKSSDVAKLIIRDTKKQVDAGNFVRKTKPDASMN